MESPLFTIKNKFQKRSELYEDILTNDILSDVCLRITGQADFDINFDNADYNIGRLAILEYNGSSFYISFSESEIKSRNSFFQSFPSALVRYYQEANLNKQIYFYFLPANGNIETPYFNFMYRLMKTAGTVFLNEGDHLNDIIAPFNSVSDIIIQRDLNRQRNRGNSSTYVTINENNILQIFGKTYGASKYETTLLCLAIRRVIIYDMELYEIKEGNLKKLPEGARNLIIAQGIKVFTSDLTLEREEFETNDSLRSPTYIYNLLEKLGEKKCSLCGCEIPQIIQGAHIWPVASIKRVDNFNLNVKIHCATDGDNGLWLCNNHHKLFDINMLFITSEGRIKYKTNIDANHDEYIHSVTINRQIPEEVLTPDFLEYLGKRNILLNENLYTFVDM